MARSITGAILRLTRQLLPIAIVVGIWQAAASLHWVDTAFLPAPVGVARALGDLLSGHEIRDNLLVTLWRELQAGREPAQARQLVEDAAS